MSDGANIYDLIIAIISTPIVGVLAVILKRKFDKRKLGLLDDTKLSKHPFFARVKSLKNHLLYNFSLPNKGKELLFREILISNIDIRVDLLKVLCTKIDNDEITTVDELYSEHMNLLQNSIEVFSNYYINDKFTEEEQRVLKIVIDKFNIWHYKRTEQTPQLLDCICNSVFYSDIKIKSAVILDTYMSELINTVQDAQMTLNELNGDLSGLAFKGKII